MDATEEQREKRLEKVRRWRRRHPDEYRNSTYMWRIANPERWKAIKRKSNNKTHRELRNRLLTLLGRECAFCGYNTDERALQIDHVNGGGLKERKALRTYTAYAKHIFAVNGEGYQTLCANCNQIKRFENREDFKYKDDYEGFRAYNRKG